MSNRVVSIRVTVTLVCALVLFGSAKPVGASEPATSAKASITFDVKTGEVLSEHNARTPLRVASTFKLLTALVVRSNVPMDSDVLVTARAERVPPLKLTMKAGSRWGANDLLHAMLIASLNDAATALAIRAGGGSLGGFHRAVDAEARRLGLSDRPVLRDPAGLDGAESVDGGNLISARDLAIVTRTFLADPLLAGIVRLPSYHFTGGDGRPHVVYNHNAFLSIYPGAIGVKTGYTEASGHSLVAAATRDGRTLATVVIDSEDPVGDATTALDAAFAAGTTDSSADFADTLPPLGIAPSALGDGVSRSRPVAFTARVEPMHTTRSMWVPVGAVLAAIALGTKVANRGRRGARGPRPVDRPRVDRI